MTSSQIEIFDDTLDKKQSLSQKLRGLLGIPDTRAGNNAYNRFRKEVKLHLILVGDMDFNKSWSLHTREQQHDAIIQVQSHFEVYVSFPPAS